MLIRPAEPKDAGTIAAILNPIIAETTITFAPDSVTGQVVRDEVQNHAERGDPYLVAEDAGMVFGLGKYGPFRGGAGYARTAEITVHLAPDARDKGFGRALVEALEAHARAAGKRSLIAGISGDNESALAFHAHLGFAQVARIPQAGHKFGRYIDLVLMQKFL